MLFLLLASTISVFFVFGGPPPIAYTRKGAVKGFLNEHLDGSITSNFLGIPYARPPVGELRFQRPQPPPDFDELYEATEWKDSCMQKYDTLNNERHFKIPSISQTYGEDCLQLNIFYPGDFVERDEDEKIAVMVWLYGGRFNVGSANDPLTNCDILSRQTGNIVVSLDYRLGVLGNLLMDEPGYHGNMGLYDQRMALQWIQENIRAFGGDPDAVTIFGESAGSYSVQAHVVSPESEGLFQRAIGESGNLNRFLPVPKESALVLKNKLLNATNCLIRGDAAAQLKCLRAIPAELLQQISDTIAFPTGHRVSSFTMTTDGDFIPFDYLSRVRNGQVSKVSSIWGSNSLESNVLLRYIAPDGLNTGLTAEQTESALQFAITRFTNKEAAYDALIGYYFPSGIGSEVWTNLVTVCRMLQDMWYEGPKASTLNGMLKPGVKNYEYYFLRRPPTEEEYEYVGAHHGDELAYVFGWFLPGGIYEGNGTSADVGLSKSIMHAWGTFARTGEPMYLDSNGSEYTWPKYDSDSRKYLRFDVNMTKETAESRSLWTENKEFVNEILDKID